MSEPKEVTITAYGRVDKAALLDVQNTYDTQGLLNCVDELDQLLKAAVEQNGIREKLLRLHGMAHTVVNGAALSVSAYKSSLPELADDTLVEIQEIISTLQSWINYIRPLEKFAPKE